VFAAMADIIIVDNMNLNDMREAIKLVAVRILLEASGGVRFGTPAARLPKPSSATFSTARPSRWHLPSISVSTRPR
jgi:hypothetical protein